MLPLSRPLPLRNSTVWGEYRAAQVIPHVFGLTVLAPIPYDRAGYFFAVADHPIQAINALRLDDVDSVNFRLVHQPDSTGRIIALLETGERIPPDVSVSVTVAGQLHPTTGALADNPADVIAALYQLLGRTPPSWVADFALACQQAGLRIGGLFADASLTARAQIDQIITSLAAQWSGASGAWMLGTAPTDWHNLTDTNSELGAAQAGLAGVAGGVRVRYRYDWGTGAPLETAVLRVRNSDAPTVDLDARWLQDSRSALAAGTRWLNRYGRPAFSADVVSADLLPLGSLLALQSPLLGSVTTQVMGAEFTHPGTGEYRHTLSWPAAAAPVVDLAGLTLAVAPVKPELTIRYEAGVLTLLVLDDETNAPIPNAEVTLDNVTTRLTDNNGSVQFDAEPGAHTLLIRVAGLADQALEVTL